ncbi:multifunctional CCA tRNA nucleotidyl transferase/2'3'-cyclic phosphodiesterase/2'nucleotidase/phosphatase [Marinobacter sp.]|uniref:multifunctional CCA tRNA nucleotidyl transferase/2'3'-cyclic phosphodiesterase/2'nucleotidase/phosphatase n=1 Tax=Marinobacter sp. TaxID=50741 RepID=UPI0019FC094B|nr:multifunctional CCA tRNA nucleotidyl transferase/2'3'-cyclic phosphodiesterase/2'nucleotidase/phosphatase [Marinobacter sp.]MBE0486208.1 multifunctional CCA tRNA nucleotidyl transferase/2'3'-cyclic phosphodiesterase/2'nucleotidase/phosphatase [Marinobacter sp.]
MQTYLVGGAVRDKLLGLEVKDRDWVVVGSSPDEMRAKGFKQVGADFPVFLHPKTGEEYALARTERKQGRGYHGFTVYSAPDVTLEQDLKRRDLTINAMAETEDGQLVDPFHGYADLQRRTLRHVSEAFAEDPLRILRTARFAARLQPMGFTICQQTTALMRTMVNDDELADLAPERVWQEVQRALHEQAPGVFFDVLRELGALDRLIPELADTHTFRNGLQGLHCVHCRGGTTAQRFAALLCSVPEPAALSRAKAMKSPNDCREMAHLVCLFTHRLADHKARATTPEEAMELLDQADIWRRADRFEQLIDTLSCTTSAELAEFIVALRNAAKAALDVRPQALIKQGFKGKELGAAIRNERLQRITQVLTQ